MRDVAAMLPSTSVRVASCPPHACAHTGRAAVPELDCVRERSLLAAAPYGYGCARPLHVTSRPHTHALVCSGGHSRAAGGGAKSCSRACRTPVHAVLLACAPSLTSCRRPSAWQCKAMWTPPSLAPCALRCRLPSLTVRPRAHLPLSPAMPRRVLTTGCAPQATARHTVSSGPCSWRGSARLASLARRTARSTPPCLAKVTLRHWHLALRLRSRRPATPLPCAPRCPPPLRPWTAARRALPRPRPNLPAQRT